MKELQERILVEGQVLSERVLKVDSFLNHQVDPKFIMHIGEKMAQHFQSTPITKILTVEASGIQFAFATALTLGVPFVYAKKRKAITQSDALYHTQVYSYTRQEAYDMSIAKSFLSPDDRVLIVDDILAEGAAVMGLLDIVKAARAQVVGVTVAIEKSFQDGPNKLCQAGVPVYALTRILSMSPEKGIEFATRSQIEEEIQC